MTCVSKEVTFDTAHMLTGHPGLCRNLHGHTYHLFVEVEGEPHEDGMVIDFKELKRCMNAVVVDRFDHAYMYDSRSEIETSVAKVLESNGLRTVPLPFRTTAENLAKYFYQELSARVHVSSVRVMETPTSTAEYRVAKC